MSLRLAIPLLLLPLSAFAEDLYSNSGSFTDPLGITHPGAGCMEHDVSALQTSLGLQTFGFDMGPASAIADDVLIPQGEVWIVEEIEFFWFQSGATQPSIESFSLWFKHAPLSGEPTFVSAASTTNFTTVDRASDQSLADCTRRVQSSKVLVSPPQYLYQCSKQWWIVWRAETAAPGAPQAVPIVVAGQLQKPGANARIYDGTKFVPAVDAGVAAAQQDFSFILRGTRLMTCKWDLNCDGKVCRADLGQLLAGFGTVYNQGDLGGMLSEYNGGCGNPCQ